VAGLIGVAGVTGVGEAPVVFEVTGTVGVADDAAVTGTSGDAGVTPTVAVAGDVATTGELGVVAGADTADVVEAEVGVVTGLTNIGLPRDETKDVAPAEPSESLPPPQAVSAIVASIEAETLTYIMVGTGLLIEFAGGIPIPGATERGSCG
jgi:hypothetical protein